MFVAVAIVFGLSNRVLILDSLFGLTRLNENTSHKLNGLCEVLKESKRCRGVTWSRLELLGVAWRRTVVPLL